jgi:hypothetical protein
LPKCRLPRYIQGSFTCRKSATWDPRLYFPSEGRSAEDFSALKNPTASAGFETANLVPEASTLTPRPPKPLVLYVNRGEEKPTRCHSMIYCSCELLYMFRALICPSSGAPRLYLNYNTRCEVPKLLVVGRQVQGSRLCNINH